MCGWSRKLFALVALGLLVGCAKQESGPASTLRLSQRNEPADLDPATATLPDEFFIIRALGEGLLTPDPAGGPPHPAMAESFSVSPDGLAYTFHLRANAKWSNGEPVTASDFVSAYRRVLTPATAAPKANLFFAVKNAREFATGKLADFSAVGFAAPDPQTLVVTLATPAPRFPYYVASGPWIPANPRAVAQHQRKWTQPANYVGNGPFLLAEWRPQQRIVVKKNPAYYAADKIKLTEIQFLRLDNQDTEERAYRAGQVDITMSVPQTKIDTWAMDRPRELHRTPLAETRFIAFNTNRPALQDERVRRALSLALNRQQLIDRVTRGGQEPAHRFLAPELHSGVSDPGDAAHHDDAEEARRLFAAAGFTSGTKFPKLELSAWSPSQQPVIEAIQEMWHRELGVDVQLAIHEAKVHLAALTAGNYDLAFVVNLIDVPDPVAVLHDFTAAAPNNFPHWRSDEFDRLVAEAALQRDERTAAQLLGQAETLLLRAAPIAPVYFNTKNWLMAPRVQGWQEDALWTRFYQNVSVDEK